MSATQSDRLYGDTSSMAVKAPVAAVATSNNPLAGLAGLAGGYVPNPGDRILCVGQNDPTTNGIYIASASGWNRSGDFQGANQFVQGTLVVVANAQAAGPFYQLTTPTPQIGQALAFAPYAPQGNLQNQAFQGGPNDIANITITRNAAYAGGVFGFVNGAMRLIDNVSNAETAFEWTLTSILNNSSTGTSQNVAGYFQGNAQLANSSSTWAAVAELIDNSGAASPANGRVTLELDNRANGADANTNRIVLHIVGSRPVAGGAAATIGAAVLIDNNGDGGNTSYQNGVIFGNKGGGLCTFATGINMLNGTYTSAAIWLPSGAPILFDTPGAQQILYDATGLQYKSAGNPASRLNADGSIVFGGSTLPLKLNGTTAATATAGGGQATPGTVLGYLLGSLLGTGTIKVPYYAA